MQSKQRVQTNNKPNSTNLPSFDFLWIVCFRVWFVLFVFCFPLKLGLFCPGLLFYFLVILDQGLGVKPVFQ